MSTNTSYVFDYIPQPSIDLNGNTSDIFRPYIPIQLSHGRLGQTIYALVDSGADRNLFPAALAAIVGINVRKGHVRQITGIGGYIIKAYTHETNILIGSKKFSTTVDFSYDQEIPLLGRSGFFDLFTEVKFWENKRLLELVSK